MLRPLLLKMSKSEKWKHRISNWRITRGTVKRFVAGDTLDQAVVVARGLNDRGFFLTMDHLGEAVLDSGEADSAAREYGGLLDRIKLEDLKSTISVKPTQLGLAVDSGLTRERILNLVRKSVETNSMVEIDMEDHPFTDLTLDIYEKARAITPNVRVCIQSYMQRSAEDLERLISIGGNIRLVKGAYKEPANVAFQKKSQVDNSYRDIMDRGMSAQAREKGFFVAMATHDMKLIEHAKAKVEAGELKPDQFEFQFLYGVKGQVAAQLVEQGYNIRLYLPYGSQWYPYFMRRLAERPANLFFIMRNMFSK